MIASRLRLLAILPLAMFSVALRAGELLSVELTSSNGSAVVATFKLSEPAGISSFRLSEPDRYVVDFASTVPAPDYQTPPLPAQTAIVNLREGRQADGRMRLVFDLKTPLNAVIDSDFEKTPGKPYTVQLTLTPKDDDETSGDTVAEASKRASDSTNSRLSEQEVEATVDNGSAAPSQSRRREPTSFVFGRERAAEADESPMADASSGWRARLTRGLVEAGALVADESRPGSNLHIQTVGTLTRSLNENIEVRLGARFDGHVQGGDIESYDLAEMDYDETFIRYRSENWRATVGAQRILWGRADEISPTDRLSTRDLTRFILDDLPNRRRANPALRLELLRDDWTVDLVYLPVFREAELPGAESIWSPLGIAGEGVAGLPLDPATATLLANARIENDVSGDGGGGVRVSRYSDSFDYALTVQRVRNPEPYLALSEPTSAGPATLETVYPRTWVVGGDFGVAVANWTFRFEGAWLSDAPYTDRDFNLQTTDAVNWVLGAEVFPGDKDTRLTLQLVGMHLLDAEGAVDREDTLGLTGAIETPLPDRRWRARLRWWAGLNRRDDYINPEIRFTGWEPSEIYLGMNLFFGDEGTLGDFYNRNNMVVLGWRGRF